MGIAESDGPVTLTWGGTQTEHIIDVVRPSVPDGFQGGYITRRLASVAAVGCTCGFHEEGTPEEATKAYQAHVDAVRGQMT